MPINHKKVSPAPPIGGPNTITTTDWNAPMQGSGGGADLLPLLRRTTHPDGMDFAASQQEARNGLDVYSRGEVDGKVGGITAGFTYVDAKLEYGAKGDGSTDDRAAIQAALDSRRGPVYLRPGTYMVSGSLVMWDSSQLLGAGTFLTYVKPFTSGVNAIYASNCNYVGIESLTIQSPVASGNGSSGIIFDGVSYLNVERVWIGGHFHFGIFLNNCHNGQIQATVINNTVHGICLQQTSQMTLFSVTSLSPSSAGLLLQQDCFELTIIKFTCIDFGTHGVYSNGILHTCVFTSLATGNNAGTLPRGFWFQSVGRIYSCFFFGVAYWNTAPMAVTPDSDYWFMEGTTMKTNTGTVWAPTSTRAWGHLSTTGDLAGSYGVDAIVRIGVGWARVMWRSPAVFQPPSYAVNVTPTSALTVGISGQVMTMNAAYVEVGFVANNAFYDTGFTLQAGGAIVV